MGDIAVAATEASEALRSVAGNEDLKINLDVSDLETVSDHGLRDGGDRCVYGSCCSFVCRASECTAV